MFKKNIKENQEYIFFATLLRPNKAGDLAI